jgi:hypothetical protein
MVALARAIHVALIGKSIAPQGSAYGRAGAVLRCPVLFGRQRRPAIWRIGFMSS